MSKVVVALGGNALGNTPEGQIEAVRKAAPSIMGLVKAGHQVVIGHGNGPQVGMINNAFDFASQGDGKTPYMPLVECGAMSQGYIGYHLQQALQAEAERVGLKLDVVSVVTQVEVSAQDPSFQDPSKPVGNFCSKEEADAIAAEKGWTFVEDAGRGYRRVVPSPLPVKIVEMDAIKKMMEMGMVVIAVGGGGIPVICKGDRYVGIDAVIDKDGWFDSGDLGLKTLDGELILRGRKKDTIVLRGGENPEPVPIEMKLQESPFIAQAVVLGQDQRFLGALIVADETEVKSYAAEQGILADSFEDLLAKPEIKKLFERQIASLINHENGFKLFERINRFVLLAKPFEAGVELSAKQDVMRYKITSLYSNQIDSLFAD